jgi:hypothetical protein
MSDCAPKPNASRSLRSLRDRITELERKARGVVGAKARHDVTNALGAARNAIILLDEGEDDGKAARFVEIAQRNVAQAEAILNPAPRGDEPEREPSAGDKRDDLRGSGERDDRDAFGL